MPLSAPLADDPLHHVVVGSPALLHSTGHGRLRGYPEGSVAGVERAVFAAVE